MHEKFIARQPIFDTRLKVYAYELLFRGGPENFFQPRTHSSASVITDATTLFDLDMLAGHARAFVNVDELALRLGAARLFSPDRIVVEILETVKPTKDIVEICQELRAAGYLLALDDFVDDPSYEPLVKLAQFLKVDFKLTGPDARKLIAQKYRSKDISLGGMFIYVEQPLPFGAELVVHVLLPGQKAAFALPGVVRWSRPGEGMGIQFGLMGARLILAPDWKPIVWTEVERKKGQAWGLKTIESFHTYGTPPVEGDQS